MSDEINNPAHYNQYKIEVIELTEPMNFCTGNICKYVLRAAHKGCALKDLNKSIWYLKRLMKSNRAPGITDRDRELAEEFDCAIFQDVFEWLSKASRNNAPSLLINAIERIELEIEVIK